MGLVRPRKLRAGDTVGLIGTSGHSPQENLEAAVKVLEQLGLRIKLGRSCTQRHGYFSGRDDIRAHDVNAMFADSSVAAVFAMRGGYGCSRLLGKINLSVVRQNPKIFCGYSDITFLHILFNQLCGLETYHTPMPTTELYKGLDDYSMSYYKKVIFGGAVNEEALGEVFNPEGQPMETLADGYAEGMITGGNLSVAVSTLGTPAEIDCKNKILFLEDVDEDIYSIDRMLCQLRNAGKLEDACGIILGGFTNCGSDSGGDSESVGLAFAGGASGQSSSKKNGLSLREVFNELIVSAGKPTVSGLALGHCLPTLSIPLGAPVRLNATQRRIMFC